MKQLLKYGDKPYHIRWLLQKWSSTIKDKYKVCQICSTDNNLIAHHIFHKVKYPKLMFNKNNGITLCKKCHYEVHGGVFRD